MDVFVTEKLGQAKKIRGFSSATPLLNSRRINLFYFLKTKN